VTGTTAVTGHIDHRHRDGLFSGQDQSIKCSLHATAGRETKLRTVLRLRYSHARHRVAVSVFSPMTVALIRLPGACPGQGDSLDGLYDNYVTPGFSFSRGYGSARWFRSATVVIPAGVFRRSSRIWIPFRQTRQGTPPGDCAVPFPAYEQCRAAGSWSGLLTLTARP
jgi:hypothetical protein